MTCHTGMDVFVLSEKVSFFSVYVRLCMCGEGVF